MRRSFVLALSVAASSASAQMLPNFNGLGAGSLAMPGVPGQGGASGSRVTTGVSTTLFASDNITHRGDGSEQAGYRSEVAPRLSAQVNNDRLQGLFSYTLRAIYADWSGNSSTALRHNLSASGNALLLGDWLGIQGSARSYDTYTSPFGTLGADPSTVADNRTRITTLTTAPYIRGHAGSFADYQARYSVTQTDVAGSSSSVSTVSGRRYEQLMANVASGSQFRDWTWSLMTSRNRYEFGNGLAQHSASTVATLRYVFSPELRVGVSANHQYFERLVDSNGNNSGWGPGVSLDWSPNRRTTLRVNLIDNYYGQSANLAIAHRGERWTAALNHTRSVVSSANAGIVGMSIESLMTGGGYTSALNPVFDQLVDQGVLSRDDVLFGVGVLNDALLRNRATTLTLGYILPRGALSLTAFRTVRETLVSSTLFVPAGDPLLTSAFGHFETRSLRPSFTLRLDGKTTLSASGTISDVQSLATPDRARVTIVSTSLSTRLDAKTTLTGGVRRVLQSSVQGGVSGYDENIVFGTFDFRF